MVFDSRAFPDVVDYIVVSLLIMEGNYVKILVRQNPRAMTIGVQTDSPIFLAVFSIMALTLAAVLLVKARAKPKNSYVHLSSAVVLAVGLALTLLHETKSSSRKARNVKTSVKDEPQEGREESVLGLGSFTTTLPMVHHAGTAKEQTLRRSCRLFTKMPTFPCSSTSSIGKNN